ncbi:hypothetical protein GCM10019059_12010 [Camelimonas fluminis]|nr:hypothetical protein GCM10019059_12010 [Camelimonas fluminis]
MAGRPEEIEHIGELGVLANRDNIGARNHRVFDAALMERQDVADKRSLRRGKLLGRRAMLQNVFQIVAHGRSIARPGQRQQAVKPSRSILPAG